MKAWVDGRRDGWVYGRMDEGVDEYMGGCVGG